MRGERALSGRRCPNGGTGIAERDEEAVALRIDLSTVRLRERLAEEPAMIRQHVGIPFTELLEQACRPFDVREEEKTMPAGSSVIGRSMSIGG